MIRQEPAATHRRIKVPPPKGHLTALQKIGLPHLSQSWKIMDTDAVSDIKIVRQVQGDDGAACV
jgi:hypothetical protein